MLSNNELWHGQLSSVNFGWCEYINTKKHGITDAKHILGRIFSTSSSKNLQSHKRRCSPQIRRLTAAQTPHYSPIFRLQGLQIVPRYTEGTFNQITPFLDDYYLVPRQPNLFQNQSLQQNYKKKETFPTNVCSLSTTRWQTREEVGNVLFKIR